MYVIDEVRSAHRESKCDNHISMNWSMAAGVAAVGSEWDDASRIPQFGSNLWRFFMHFEERPGDFFPDSCPEPPTAYFRARPHNFTFNIASADTKTYFSGADPANGDDTSDNQQLGLFLDLLGSVGNVYVSAGSALINYLMAGGGSHTYVSYEPGGVEYTFDIDVVGDHDDLPREIANPNVAAVYLRTHNEQESGTHPVYYTPEYTFEYSEFTGWGGNCGCDGSRINNLYKSTIPGSPSGNTAWYMVM